MKKMIPSGDLLQFAMVFSMALIEIDGLTINSMVISHRNRWFTY
jgi:hypothetical protein